MLLRERSTYLVWVPVVSQGNFHHVLGPWHLQMKKRMSSNYLKENVLRNLLRWQQPWFPSGTIIYKIKVRAPTTEIWGEQEMLPQTAPTVKMEWCQNHIFQDTGQQAVLEFAAATGGPPIAGHLSQPRLQAAGPQGWLPASEVLRVNSPISPGWYELSSAPCGHGQHLQKAMGNPLGESWPRTDAAEKGKFCTCAEGSILRGSAGPHSQRFRRKRKGKSRPIPERLWPDGNFQHPRLTVLHPRSETASESVKCPLYPPSCYPLQWPQCQQQLYAARHSDYWRGRNNPWLFSPRLLNHGIQIMLTE